MLTLSFSVLLLAITGGLSEDPGTLIVNGDQVDVTAYPHQCAILAWGSIRCGAVVLNSTHVLTAAHCVETLSSPSILTISCGMTHLTQANPGEQHSGVSHMALWAQRNPNYYNHDIAVLTLTAPFDLSGPYVKSIPLATWADGYDGNSDCWISGYGRMGTYGGPLPDRLLEASVSLLTLGYCKSVWGSWVPDNTICITGTQSDQTSCSGDSGGPLCCRAGPSAPWKLVGITNWGESNCRPQFPAGYCDVRLEEYQAWILPTGTAPPPPPTTTTTTTTTTAAPPSGGWWWGRKRRR